ncbi:HNH endonuclease [Vibrio splendidus]
MSKRKSLSKKIRFEVFKRDKFTCQYCGKTAPNVVLEVDHIEPVSKGGTNDILNLIASCFDCNRGKTDRALDDNSIIEKQRRQLEMLQDRRDQISLMFSWRNELDKLDTDVNEMVIGYIENKIENLTLSESGTEKISKLTKKYEIADILESVDISSKTYLNYDSNGRLTKDSAEEFINKIGGILVNKNRSPLLQKTSYIKGICRNRFSYWNPKTGSIILNEYISSLSDYGWSDDKIVYDLENELIPRTKECKNWSEWKKLLEQWTEDVKEWGENENDVPYEIEYEDLTETAEELYRERSNIIAALDYLGKAFENYENEELLNRVDLTVLNYLTQLEKYYLLEEAERGPKPSYAMAARSLLMLYSPVKNTLTYWLDNAVRSVVKQLLEPIEFYQEENPQHEHFRIVAEKYNYFIVHDRPKAW